MVELKVTLGPKGQVVIPKIFREYFKIYPRQEAVIKAVDNGILIVKQKQEDPIKILEEMAKIATERRKGKPFNYNKREFYEQYDKRAKRAGL